MTDLSSLNILEEKIRGMVLTLDKLRDENSRLREGVDQGTSIQNILNQKKKVEIQKKIKGMLELLKDF